MGLDEAIGLDLDRADDPPADHRNQRRDAWRGQRPAGPLYRSMLASRSVIATPT
jgi:hypothetical protein